MVINISVVKECRCEKSIQQARKAVEDILTGSGDSEYLIYAICNVIALELIKRDENIRTSSNFINTTITKIAYDLKELAVFPTPATKIVKIISDLITYNKMYLNAELGFTYGIGNKLPTEVIEYYKKNESLVTRLLSNFKALLNVAILAHKKEGLNEE